jgi:hypothetical protein
LSFPRTCAQRADGAGARQTVFGRKSRAKSRSGPRRTAGLKYV